MIIGRAIRIVFSTTFNNNAPRVLSSSSGKEGDRNQLRNDASILFFRWQGYRRKWTDLAFRNQKSEPGKFYHPTPKCSAMKLSDFGTICFQTSL